MTEQDLKSLEAAPPLMLAEWWCLLNKWEWPKEGLGEPDAAPELPEKFQPGDRRSQIMFWILNRIGMGPCLREWNRDSMSDAEFDEWWTSGRRPLFGAPKNSAEPA